MPEDDYSDVLSGTVDEAKDGIGDMENPDYRKLLQMEREGKDRKTLKEWIENRLEEADQPFDEPEDLDEVAEDLSDEPVLSSNQMLAGGAVIGVLIGLVAGLWIGGASAAGGQVTKASPSTVQQDVRDIVASDNFSGTVDVDRPVETHGMYFVNVTSTSEQGNQTVTRSQHAYVTLDGELLFPVRRRLGQTIVPVRLQERAQSGGTGSQGQ